MHRHCSKITNVKLVKIFWLYSDLIKWLPMLNVNKHGIKKIRKNVADYNKQAQYQGLIKSLTKTLFGPRKM